MENVTYDDINELKWQDVPIRSVQLISNIDKRKEYITKIKMCYSTVVNPLSNAIERRSFNFSVSDEALTCRIMVEEIKEELYKQDFTDEDIMNIVLENKA